MKLPPQYLFCLYLAICLGGRGTKIAASEPPHMVSAHHRLTTSKPAKLGEINAPDQLYPQGRVFPFFGFSGIAQRAKANHFTAFGPVYVRQEQAFAEAESASLPMIYSVGVKMNFLLRDGNPKLQLSDAEITQRITDQVRSVANRQSIGWWYLGPEELRPWRAEEMNYLKVACEAIRAADPLGRPIWMYDPNHRTADNLVATGRHLDILGKGTYVDLAGYMRSRVFVRWSIEQEKQAFERLGKQGMPLAVLELSQDTIDEEAHLIPNRVQHDVYLGLMHGAKGIAVWSLFRRATVEKQFEIYLMSYARAAEQLCGEQSLGQVFLFGEECNTIVTNQTSGPTEVTLSKGDETLEAATSTAEERDHQRPVFPALSVRELDHEKAKYLFLCNSAEQSITVEVQIPAVQVGSVQDLLSFRQHSINDRGTVTLRMPPLAVHCLKLK